MKTVRLMAHRREGNSKDAARRLRRQRRLPAMLYNQGMAEAIAVDAKELQGILQSEVDGHTLIDLCINGDPPERCRVMLRAVQTDAVSLAPVHADFYRVSRDDGDVADAVQGIGEGGATGEAEDASGNPIEVRRRPET